MNKPTMIFASALSFRPPFRTRPRCATATIKPRVFTRLAPLASRIGQYWLQLPATFGLAISPRSGSFSTACRANSPTALK
jgi:hypothetical protein